MRFEQALVLGTLIRRYKRFLADVRLDDGRSVTAHTPNSGSMRGCAEPGMRVALSHRPSPKRKLHWTWELVEVGETWVCINTSRPNHIVAEAIAAGRLGPLRGYPEVRPEVPYGTRSRIDLLLSGERGRCWVEVKNCTLRVGRRAEFPDAVTTRGAKHLRELAKVVKKGDRGVILFLVNRADCGSMAPADHIDPGYGQLLRQVTAAGVEALAYRTRCSLEGIEVDRKLPVRL